MSRGCEGQKRVGHGGVAGAGGSVAAQLEVGEGVEVGAVHMSWITVYWWLQEEEEEEEEKEEELHSTA